ncbi:hypothetical protein [Metalysinibacillus jejuensis]|uniref:hypothetical protein n=1 Tax=Metalysinibacillus jejuensis TaxID=914327 RepID=UPI000D39A6DF|nr:hypothetical protein [Metalysinibacillus jejuensis]
MNRRTTMYKITEELISEEDGLGKVDSPITKEKNSNNCKYFVQVLNAVGIDENLFKDNNGYTFLSHSVSDVKQIIKNHSVYLKEMKKHPKERNLKVINELVSHVQNILKNEILNQSYLHSQLAKVELISLNKRQQLNKYLQSLSLPNFNIMLSPADDEIVHLYYIEEMMKLKTKIESIRQIMSDIRFEEIIEKSFKEISELEPEERFKTYDPFQNKIKLDRLVIKDLLNTKMKKNQLVQETLQEYAEQLNMSEKQLIEELKKFRKSNYENHELFELSNERDYFEANGMNSPYEVLEQAIQEHQAEQTNENTKVNISQEEKEKMEKILKNRL